jgi:hypothetical protein
MGIARLDRSAASVMSAGITCCTLFSAQTIRGPDRQIPADDHGERRDRRAARDNMV